MQLPRTTATLERQRAEGLHLGAAVVVTLDAEPAGEVALGDVTPDAVVPWFSMTKVATALRAVMAWDRGAFGLDDPVAVHVPAFAVGGKDAVTVRHLLTHTGGFRGADRREPEPDFAAEVARICAVPLEESWAPGRRAGYSLRAGFTILAEVVRRATGDARPWDAVVAEDVFAPLGMGRSSLAPQVTTTLYDTKGGTARPLVDDPAKAARIQPGAGGRGPIRDAVRLVESLYLDGAPLLSRQAATAMVARHRSGIRDETFGAVLDWGLGVILNVGCTEAAKARQRSGGVVPYGFGRHASPRTFGHGGSQTSGVLCDPEHGLAAAFFADGMCGEAAHSRRADEVFTALYEDLGLAP